MQLMRSRENAHFDMIAESIAGGDDIEALVRPLLDLLSKVTGFESTFFATVDVEKEVQTVLFARNRGEVQVNEGLQISWDQSLCKRALNEGRPFIGDVAAHWGGSEVVRDPTIATYLSMPVYTSDGEMFGTLCGASGSKVALNGELQYVLSLFTYMIARQADRERLVRRLRSENRNYALEALSDPLTGIPNRRALLREMPRMLRLAERFGNKVHVAMIDLDDFKQINDTHGHEVGDRFLVEVAKRLVRGLRKSDYVARYGGDEFVVLGVSTSDDGEAGGKAFAESLSELTQGRFVIGDISLDHQGASIGVVTADTSDSSAQNILANADAAMYQVKKKRRKAAANDGHVSPNG